jgi:hypothetical protein
MGHDIGLHNAVAGIVRLGAPQFATGISGRFEASEKAIGLRIRIPSDCNEPAQVSPDGTNGMPLGNQRGPTAS